MLHQMTYSKAIDRGGSSKGTNQQTHLLILKMEDLYRQPFTIQWIASSAIFAFNRSNHLFHNSLHARLCDDVPPEGILVTVLQLRARRVLVHLYLHDIRMKSVGRKRSPDEFPFFCWWIRRWDPATYTFRLNFGSTMNSWRDSPAAT